jgi:hypothetical protein
MTRGRHLEISEKNGLPAKQYLTQGNSYLHTKIGVDISNC